jgi:hypothetical protein
MQGGSEFFVSVLSRRVNSFLLNELLEFIASSIFQTTVAYLDVVREKTVNTVDDALLKPLED